MLHCDWVTPVKIFSRFSDFKISIPKSEECIRVSWRSLVERGTSPNLVEFSLIFSKQTRLNMFLGQSQIWNLYFIGSVVLLWRKIEETIFKLLSSSSMFLRTPRSFFKSLWSLTRASKQVLKSHLSKKSSYNKTYEQKYSQWSKMMFQIS